jgi:hypothetical protein
LEFAVTFTKVAILAGSLMAVCEGAHAKACDYTPSKLLGAATTTVGTVIAGGTAAAGVGLQAAGYYTLVHAGSGLTMLGSTAAGASAAGTVGIVAGTGGAIGTVGAILMSPVTLIVGAVTFIGVGTFEGVCYFQVERITDPKDVRMIIESVASQDEAMSIFHTDDGDAIKLTIKGESDTYLLKNLYIADGQLMHSDWGLNTKLGAVLFAPRDTEE